MKSMLKIGLAVTFVLSLLGCQLTGGRPSDVDVIVAKYIEVTGRRAAQEAIKSKVRVSSYTKR